MLTIKKFELLLHQLNGCNLHVERYKSVYERLSAVATSDNQNGHYAYIFITIELKLDLELLSGNDRRIDNLPSLNEAAAIYLTLHILALMQRLFVYFRSAVNLNQHSYYGGTNDYVKINPYYPAYVSLH